MIKSKLLKIASIAMTALFLSFYGCSTIAPTDDSLVQLPERPSGELPDIVPDTPDAPEGLPGETVPDVPDTPEEPEQHIELISIYHGGVVSVYSDEVKEYLTAQYDEQPDILLEWYRTGDGSLINQFVSFSWDAPKEDVPYTVTFSKNKDMTDSFAFVTYEESLSAGVFMPGVTYFWQVTSASDIQSAVDSFVIEDLTVRFVTVDGLDNIRDLGGWQTESGQRVKYGMIYRGTQLNGYADGPELTEQGREVFEILGINSEIDMRTPGVDDNDQVSNLTGGEGKYLKAPFYAYTHIFPEFRQTNPVCRSFDERVPQSIRAIFEFLSDESNYPVYIHCNAGADRTGTIVFLINGLLGVGYEDLTADFELTSFAGAGRRWRDDLMSSDHGNGVMQDDGSNYVAWGKMYDYMMRYYGTPNGTLSSAIRSYLSSVCGVSEEVMDAVCEIMLE